MKKTIKKAAKNLKDTDEIIGALETSLQNIVKLNADGMIIVDKNNAVRFSNPSAAAMFGCGSEAELTGRVFDFPIRPGEMSEISIEHPRTKTVIIAEQQSVEVNWDNETAYLISLHDITERKEMEKRLKEALNTKSEFISMVSHELRTPLTIIKEFVNIISEGIPGSVNEKQRDYLNTIQNNINRLSLIINDLLDAAKLESGKLKLTRMPMNISSTIENIITFFKPKTDEKRISISYTPGADMPRVYGDMERINQVLTNLLGNAIKFTPERGSISISSSANENEVEVSVSDTGPGIEQEHFGLIFEPFEQITKMHRTKGTGLGLSISKKIVELHNGKIWVESPVAEGRGSNFIFTLPVYNPVLIQKEQLAASIQKAQKSGSIFSLCIIKIRKLENMPNPTPEETQIALAHLEEVARRVVRTSDDLMTNYEKGEILVILFGCDTNNVHFFKERIRKRIKDAVFSISLTNTKMRLKFGMASYPKDALSEAELYEKASRDNEESKEDLRKILIIDDDIETCRAMSALLDSRGYYAACFSDAEKALEESGKTKFDLVFHGLLMKETDITRALENLKKTNPSLQTVIITSYPNSEMIFNVMKSGPATIIAKPFDLKQIEEVLQKLLPSE